MMPSTGARGLELIIETIVSVSVWGRADVKLDCVFLIVDVACRIEV